MEEPETPAAEAQQTPTQPRAVTLVFLAGAVVSLVVAVGLYTRFSIHQLLWRDPSIYVYGAQRFAHGVAPYDSIFDPKGPLATLIGGFAALLARAVGRNDILAIRLTFFVCSVLTVLAIYVLAARLFRSVPAGIASAVVFASFPVFAKDALGGPDAKTPGILFAVVAMWLLTERRWFWAGVAAAAATLVWQPLLIFPVVAVAFPPWSSERGRRRKAFGSAAAGVAVPLVVVSIYFIATGAFGRLIEAAVDYPLTGGSNKPLHVRGAIHHIKTIILTSYGHREAVILGLGIGLLVAAAIAAFVRGRKSFGTALRDPLIAVVLVTFLFEAAFALDNFQGPPDTLPFTPYAALGFGAATAALVQVAKNPVARKVAIAGAMAAAVLLAAVSWVDFGDNHDRRLLDEYSDACGVERILGPTGTLYSLGDPTPLVLTHRKNPDRFIYLEEKVDRWKVDHTSGGFDAWAAQVDATHPSVVILQGWRHGFATRMHAHLIALRYLPAYLGPWRLYLQPEARADARRNDVRLTDFPTKVATDLSGQRLPRGHCT